MRPDCQLRAFNVEVTGSFTIALSPCSHSCPPTLVPSFGNDGEGCCGWCIALSFHGTSSLKTWRSSAISPNNFGPSLVLLGRFPPRPGPLGLIFEMGRGTQILWPHSLASTLKEIQLIGLIMKILCNYFKIWNIAESNCKTLYILVLVFNFFFKKIVMSIYLSFFFF